MRIEVTQTEVEDAREHANALKDRIVGMGTAVGEPAEEIAANTDAISWLAAEVRAQRLENAFAGGR